VIAVEIGDGAEMTMSKVKNISELQSENFLINEVKPKEASESLRLHTNESPHRA